MVECLRRSIHSFILSISTGVRVISSYLSFTNGPLIFIIIVSTQLLRRRVEITSGRVPMVVSIIFILSETDLTHSQNSGRYSCWVGSPPNIYNWVTNLLLLIICSILSGEMTVCSHLGISCGVGQYRQLKSQPCVNIVRGIPDFIGTRIMGGSSVMFEIQK